MKTAICVLIKDENDYLDEWLKYHLNLGIDEIFLYEDYGSKSHLDIVKSYGEKVHLNPINVIYYDDFKYDEKRLSNCSVIQEQLFSWFPIKYRDSFDWILFIDIDEFLCLKQTTLSDLLNEYKNKSHLYLQWKYYGASNHIHKPIGNVVDNFTSSYATSFDFYWSYKSFVNCKFYTHWKTPIHGVNGGIYPITEFGEHKAWINHYFTKSWEEWKWKLLNRGDTYIGNRKITQFFKINPDMLPLKNDLLLEIAIENATKLGFNQNKEKGNKYLHFCWFGGNEFKNIHLKTMESWKKFVSDEFIVCLWNESSFGFNDYEFTKKAYNNKSWAFVADFVRLWAVYNFGGIYLDTDVELLKPINNLPTNFFAIEKDYNAIALGLGFGAEKENEIIGNILKIYEELEFNPDNMHNITIPIITMQCLNKLGYELNNNEIHNFNGFTIYPDIYFCPKSNVNQTFDIQDETIAIHHYIGSWAI